jgi:hypothetical protein
MRISLGDPYRGHCLFCGSKSNLTDEHVISKGVRRRMPVAGVQAVAGIDLIGKPQTSIHIVLKDAVCKGCNGKWMSRLERGFVRILGPQLSTPQAVRLDPSHQERLSRWIVKTALLLQLYTAHADLGTGYFVPPSHLRWMANHEAPPPYTQVWLGAIRDPGNRAIFHQSGALAVDPGSPISYFSTFSLGYLLFQVHGVDIPSAQDPGTNWESLRLDPPPPLDEALTNIWPGQGADAVWPPTRAIEVATLGEVSGWPGRLIDYFHGTTG